MPSNSYFFFVCECGLCCPLVAGSMHSGVYCSSVTVKDRSIGHMPSLTNRSMSCLHWRRFSLTSNESLIHISPCPWIPLRISYCIEVTEVCLNQLSSMQRSHWAITPAPTESEVTTVWKKANVGSLQWLWIEGSACYWRGGSRRGTEEV